MSRTAIIKNQVLYRTNLMSQSQAIRFEKMLSRNPLFEQVQSVRSDQAKPGKDCYVTFLPANPLRKDALHAAQQNSRQRKGEAQDFQFIADSDTLNLWWCLSPSGNTYAVTLFDCDCPDYVTRCMALGCNCKHQHALSKYLRERTNTQEIVVSRSCVANSEVPDTFSWEGLV